MSRLDLAPFATESLVLPLCGSRCYLDEPLVENFWLNQSCCRMGYSAGILFDSRSLMTLSVLLSTSHGNLRRVSDAASGFPAWAVWSIAVTAIVLFISVTVILYLLVPLLCGVWRHRNTVVIFRMRGSSVVPDSLVRCLRWKCPEQSYSLYRK